MHQSFSEISWMLHYGEGYPQTEDGHHISFQTKVSRVIHGTNHHGKRIRPPSTSRCNPTHKILIVDNSHCHCEKANGKGCLCANFSMGLNDVLDTHQYPEDFFAKFSVGTCFAKTELAEAYLSTEQYKKEELFLSPSINHPCCSVLWECQLCLGKKHISWYIFLVYCNFVFLFIAFLQHSSPMQMIIYHLISTSTNSSGSISDTEGAEKFLVRSKSNLVV